MFFINEKKRLNYQLDLARVEGAAESDVNVVVEESWVVAHRVRVRNRRGIRNRAVHKVIKMHIVDTLVKEESSEKIKIDCHVQEFK